MSPFDEKYPETLEEKDDHTLMNLCKQGEYRAFETLYHRYRDQLLNYAWKFSDDFELAADAVQETFLYLFEKIDEYEPRASLKTLLYKVARNTTLYQLRKKRKAANPDMDWDDRTGEDLPPPPDRQAEAGEHVQKIRQAIQRLSETYRDVLMLRVMEDFQYDEIAEITDLKLGTVKSRLYKGLRKLRDELKEDLPELTPDSPEDTEI